MVNLIYKKKKSKKNGRKLVILGVLIVVLGWFYYASAVNNPVSEDGTTQVFIVEPGWGSTRISHELEDAGLIRNAYIFQLHVWKNGIDNKLQDGEYFFSKSQSLKEIAQILNRGAGASKEATLTFLEGWKIEDIADYLEDKLSVSRSEFISIVQTKAPWWDEYKILNSKPRNLDLEGYLFPDTYRVFKDATAADIVKKMLANMESKFTQEILEEINRQEKTVHEILTIASIIEKEVQSDSDKKKVADIFYKRLDAGIALQADSTVNYVTGKSDPRVSAADLAIDSLYNTYKYRGLPPGPISNPGLSSIMAAIYPESNPYYYFLTTPDGEAIYNIDFEGHVRDKNKYY